MLARRFLELGYVLVEVSCSVRFSVDQEGAHPDQISGLLDTEERISHKGTTDSVPLYREINTQAGEDDDRDRVPSCSCTHPGSRICLGDSPGGERVVPNDLRSASGRRHVHTSGVGVLRDPGPPA